MDNDDLILGMCNDALLHRDIPDHWKRLNIVPVPKKGNLSKVDNYNRGIALSSVVCKTLNRMIRNRLGPALEKVLRPQQNGFRPGRSTSSHILALRRILEGVKSKNLEAVLLFVDFKKAFDSLHRGILMKIIAAYGVPERMVSLVEALYEDTVASVLTEDGATELFKILAGVLQVDTLAPLLFIIAIDYVMTTTLQGRAFGFTLEQRRSSRYPAKVLSDADFADDLALLTDSKPEAQEFLTALEEAAARVGLHMNNKKTKYIAKNCDSTDICSSEGKVLEEVDDFLYLGSWVGDSNKDFTVRKAKAWKALNQMGKIWKSSMRREIKVRLFRATVEAILFYGSETWTVTKSLAKKIDGCFSRMLRAALNIHWQEKIPNKDVYRDLPRATDRLRVQRLRLAGHIARHEELTAQQTLFWKPTRGTARRGRPILTYPDILLQDLEGVCESTNEMARAMADRELWRNIIASRPQLSP